MKDAIIKVKSLKKDYYVGEMTVHALRGIDLEIYNGDFAAIMGASGSGKSTMLNILGCLDKPTLGEYYLEGVNMGQLNKNQLAVLRNNKLGIIFQSYNLMDFIDNRYRLLTVHYSLLTNSLQSVFPVFHLHLLHIRIVHK